MHACKAGSGREERGGGGGMRARRTCSMNTLVSWGHGTFSRDMCYNLAT